MAKTRQMQRLSNTNKARTRAGKAKAKANPSKLVMESVTIPVHRRGKKKRQDRIEVSPAPPPSSTLPADVVLSEGWALLKAYFENDDAVSADTVDNFLKDVDDAVEAQLRPMFGRIMGLEPGELEAQRGLRNEIDLALARLGAANDQPTKAPRRKAKGNVSPFSSFITILIYLLKVNARKLLSGRLSHMRILHHALRPTIHKVPSLLNRLATLTPTKLPSPSNRPPILLSHRQIPRCNR